MRWPSISQSMRTTPFQLKSVDTLSPLKNISVGNVSNSAIITQMMKQHCRDVEKVLQTLARAKLSAKVKKCKFAYKEIIFVGHLVKEGRVYPDPSKLEAIKAY